MSSLLPAGGVVTRCTCWRPTAPHQPDCARAREEARERAREQAAVDRLLGDLHKVYGDRLVELDGWTEGERRLAFGDR